MDVYVCFSNSSISFSQHLKNPCSHARPYMNEQLLLNDITAATFLSPIHIITQPTSVILFVVFLDV